MLAFKSTLSVAVDPPEFPEFITKFEPSIKLPYLHDMHGIYKPASQELTIIRKQEEIIKTVIKEHQINVTVPFTLALKEDIKNYIEYIFFDQDRFFKWFAEQDCNNGNVLSIATRLMIDQYCRLDVSPTIKLASIRLNHIHQTTSYLVKQFPKGIVIEDLNVQGLMKNRHLAKHIQNALFYEFRRQLEYKCLQYGIELVIAERFYPSSKMCSYCGCIKSDLKLKDRVYKCEFCGLEKDRDLNAAENLAYYFHRG